MTTVVLDASAMLAFLHGEHGSERVLSLLVSDTVHCVAHAMNVCEVFYDLLRRAGDGVAESAIQRMRDAGLTVRSDMDEAFWKSVAQRKAKGRLSLADCCGLSLAEKLGGEFYTADHHELDKMTASESVKIVFIR